MAVSEKQKAWAKKHQEEKRDEIKLRPPKGTKDRWRAAAEGAGVSLSQYIIDAVEAALAATESKQED